MNKTGKAILTFPVFELMTLVNILYYINMLDKNNERLLKRWTVAEKTTHGVLYAMAWTPVKIVNYLLGKVNHTVRISTAWRLTRMACFGKAFTGATKGSLWGMATPLSL